jgi:hypothetical protein
MQKILLQDLFFYGVIESLTQTTLPGANEMNKQQIKVGSRVNVTIYGRAVSAVVIAVHAAGTIDVETAQGCYRISGGAVNV